MMEPVTLRPVLATLGVVAGLAMLYLVRRDRLHGTYALWWVFVAGCVVTFGLFPRLIDAIGAWIGVSYPPILLVVVALLLVLLKMLTSDLDRTRELRKLRFLAQRIAILEHEVRQTAEARTQGRVPAAEPVLRPAARDADAGLDAAGSARPDQAAGLAGAVDSSRQGDG